MAKGLWPVTPHGNRAQAFVQKNKGCQVLSGYSEPDTLHFQFDAVEFYQIHTGDGTVGVRVMLVP